MSLRKVIAAGANVSPPSWLADNLCYETIMGSMAYGVSSDMSDVDVYGICFPPKEIVFPHLSGEIYGFGRQIKRFEQWQEHHIASNGKTWDFQIFSIVKFFQLAMENNPNVIDSLFHAASLRALLDASGGIHTRASQRLFAQGRMA